MGLRLSCKQLLSDSTVKFPKSKSRNYFRSDPKVKLPKKGVHNGNILPEVKDSAPYKEISFVNQFYTKEKV